MAKFIVNRWQEYTAEDCDCRLCLYYCGDRQPGVQCLAEGCVCKEELKEALLRERIKNQRRKNDVCSGVFDSSDQR